MGAFNKGKGGSKGRGGVRVILENAIVLISVEFIWSLRKICLNY